MNCCTSVVHSSCGLNFLFLSSFLKLCLGEQISKSDCLDVLPDTGIAFEELVPGIYTC